MNPTITTPPAELPVNLDTVKSHLAITGTDDDPRILDLIATAADYVGLHFGIALLTTGYLYTLQAFGQARAPDSDFWFSAVPYGDRCGATITLPRGPLIAVQSVKYRDDDNVLQTISASNYQVDTRSCPGRIVPMQSYQWPLPGPFINAVEIEFTAGYGPTAENVPPQIRHAITMLVGHWNESREAYVGSAFEMRTVPEGFDDLLGSFKHRRF